MEHWFLPEEMVRLIVDNLDVSSRSMAAITCSKLYLHYFDSIPRFEDLVREAAVSGHTAALRTIAGNECQGLALIEPLEEDGRLAQSFYEIVEACAQHGDLGALKVLLEKNRTVLGDGVHNYDTESIFTKALVYKQYAALDLALNILDWCSELTLPHDISLRNYSSEDLLALEQWLLGNGQKIRIEWGAFIASFVEMGRLDLAKRYYGHSCAANQKFLNLSLSFTKILSAGDLEAVTWALSVSNSSLLNVPEYWVLNICPALLLGGNLECLDYMKSRTPILPPNPLYYAKYDRVIDWIFRNGYGPGGRLVYNTVYINRAINGLPSYNGSSFHHIISSGSIESLQKLRNCQLQYKPWLPSPHEGPIPTLETFDFLVSMNLTPTGQPQLISEMIEKEAEYENWDLLKQIFLKYQHAQERGKLASRNFLTTLVRSKSKEGASKFLEFLFEMNFLGLDVNNWLVHWLLKEKFEHSLQYIASKFPEMIETNFASSAILSNCWSLVRWLASRGVQLKLCLEIFRDDHTKLYDISRLNRLIALFPDKGEEIEGSAKK